MPDESIHVNQRDLDALFAPGGPLSRKLPGYEYRWGQPRLSTAMLSTIDAGEHLVAEASTGIGKSLAYLAAVVASGTPVLISTDTRILQDQLKRKDVPSLAAALNVPIDVATIKGRSNYICELEFQCFAEEARRDRGLFEDPTYARQWPQIEAWVLQERANYGVAEFDEAPLPIPDAIREDISISSEQCLGRQCPLVDTCFAERAKARANTADVIIINHHLLLLGGLLGSQVWPAVKVMVVDEAHRLEDTASSVFSSTIGLPRWRWLRAQFRKVSHPVATTVSALLAEPTPSDADRRLDHLMDEGAQALDAASVEAETVFNRWADALGERRSMPIPEAPALLHQMRAVCRVLQRILPAAAVANTPDETLTLWERVKRAAESLAYDLQRALEDPPTDGLVRFVEKSGPSAVARLVPIDVAPALREYLWDRFDTVIATSATLTTGGTFDFWLERVGAPEDTRTLQLSSPFDFRRQARLFLPRPAPAFEPRYPGRQGYDAYVDRMTTTLIDLIQASQGRALILCTSVRSVKLWAERVRPDIPWRTLVQGEAPRQVLLREFTADIHSVLFATKSFWQGIDVAGESLSLLVIDKLPFPSPDDPVFAAQCAIIDRGHQGVSFSKLSLPIATLAVRQGFGRLIRRGTDRGVVAILDGRLHTKGYGAYVLRTLPPTPPIQTIEAVARFLAEGGTR